MAVDRSAQARRIISRIVRNRRVRVSSEALKEMREQNKQTNNRENKIKNAHDGLMDWKCCGNEITTWSNGEQMRSRNPQIICQRGEIKIESYWTKLWALDAVVCILSGVSGRKTVVNPLFEGKHSVLSYFNSTRLKVVVRHVVFSNGVTMSHVRHRTPESCGIVVLTTNCRLWWISIIRNRVIECWLYNHAETIFEY